MPPALEKRLQGESDRCAFAWTEVTGHCQATGLNVGPRLDAEGGGPIKPRVAVAEDQFRAIGVPGGLDGRMLQTLAVLGLFHIGEVSVDVDGDLQPNALVRGVVGE